MGKMIWITVLAFACSSVVRSFNVSRYDLGPLAQQLSCELPPYPGNGTYLLTTEDSASTFIPGRIYIKVVCDSGYSLIGAIGVYCDKGEWTLPIARCVKYCVPERSLGIQFYGNKNGKINSIMEGSYYGEDGDTLYPRCVLPYHHEEELPPLHCRGTKWSHKPRCTPVCGLQRQLVDPKLNAPYSFSSGWSASESEVPWHAGIYNKLYEPYMQICGASIIGRNIVVSAAHCFWSDIEGLQPPSRFAVAAGKLYRPWNFYNDHNAQKSNVIEIVISPRFWGSQTNFQDDIALVFLNDYFDYNRFLWPICIDFNTQLDNEHLSPGKSGISAGWGLTEEDGRPAQTLQVLSLPYVDTYKCIADAEPDYRVYITSDKFCAGHTNGSAACRGDSGGGLAFLETDEKGDGYYYLRGIVSTSPKNEYLCNTFAISAFTRVSKHEELFQRNYHKIVW